MKLTKSLSIGSLLLVFLLGFPIPPVRALTVFDPANYAQNLLTAARTLQSVEQQIQQLANEAQTLLNMEKNLASLGDTIAPDLIKKLNTIRGLLDKAKGLTLNIKQLETAYGKLYPNSYETARSMDETLRTAQERWDTRLASFKASFGIQAQILDNIENDTTQLNALMSRSQDAIGAKSAIQANSEILALNVKQLMQLQTLLAVQGRAVSLEQSEQAANQEEARAYLKRFIGISKE